MKRKISLATLLLLGAVPFAAIAAEPAQPQMGSPATKNAPAATAPKEEPAPLFEQLDVNHDGYVTKQEAKRSADITARFAKLDVNHDGKISVAEFKDGMQSKY